ncbi:hypothetical protein MTO98_07360 [Mucilaginibacter sp. SMC90]|uniref:hypothetical protein n=1 Tax=Mucilaginibacter sp. SMC90 TaxID=2929803 RepID=UPI001FB4FB7F|nr:hypothetical protein [Mucilaginibacter sp. SMC90]UOE50894.1 hypothetical protein MTO98_07360 [Mucilaginibacter sp. SMC90]
MKNFREAEAEFFRSVHNICEMYGIPNPDVTGLPFPENLHKAHAVISKALELLNAPPCYIMQDDRHVATLATAKRYDTGHALYYIPVHALARIGDCPGLKPLYELLVFICHYLYRVSGAEFYRDKYSYIGSVYDTLEDWMLNDNDGECYDELIAEIAGMKTFGDSLLQKLKLPFSKRAFDESADRFRESECYAAPAYELAMEFEKLMADYPKRSIYSSIPKEFYEWQEEGAIEIGHYLGFYWSGSESLNDQFFDYVNNELQECSEQVEPIALQWFDSPQKEQQFDFDYEGRLFPLLIEFNNFLYQYDYVNEHHQ